MREGKLTELQKNTDFDIISEMEEAERRHKETEKLLAHEKLRCDVLNYMIEHDDDPVELLKTFAERVRVLLNCDQLIYRDLSETRIMVNSPEIEKTWAVPMEYCLQCEHFDAHHPMYRDGYTEMSNCQEGWQGIPVYKDCPIKSSLTRIVNCDNQVAGYLAIHYVQKYHEFTEIERETIESFAGILSISLSRYEAKKSAGELNSVKKTLGMMFALSDQFDPIIVIEPETGEYDWLMSVAQDVVNNTSMSMHGDNIYKNIGIDGASIIHEDDRAQFQAFYTRENMMKIAETGEPREIENRWYIQTEGRYKLKYNKAVRMVDDNGKAYVIVGVIDTTEAHNQKKRLEEANVRLNDAQRRIKLLHSSVKASIWSYDINSDDEVVAAHYDVYARDKTVVVSDEPMEWVNALHPEDRERVYRHFMAAIHDHTGNTPYDTTYRMARQDGSYIWLKTSGKLQVHEDGTAELFGISVDITEEVNEQKARQSEAEESKKLIASIASAYKFAMSVNMTNCEFKVIKLDAEVKKKLRVTDFGNFKEALKPLFSILHLGDRKMMAEELEFDTIRRKLRDRISYKVEYRIISEGATNWHEMNVTMIDREKELVALGFGKRDFEITQKHLEDRRYAEYFALYEIDIDTGMMKIVKDSPYYGIDRVGTAMAFSPAMLRFASGLDPEPHEFFEKFSILDYAKEKFATEDKITYAYRSNNVDGRRWVDCTGYVTLRHSDGTPAMFTLGFSLMDTIGIMRQEMQKQIAENMKMIGGLATDYDALYYINIDEGINSVYTLNEKKYPGALKNYEEESDIYKLISRYGQSEHIHPDDRYLFDGFTAESIREKLVGTKRYSARFRTENGKGGYRWDEMDIIKYEEADELANAIAVGFADRDDEIQAELDQQKQLETARDDAEAANKSKTSFLFNMSHDIRTPMNAIIGFTGMAKKYIDDREKTIDYLNKIDISGQQLLNLINQVLEMARIESGKLELDSKPVVVHEEYESLVTVLTEQAKAYGLQFFASTQDIVHDYVMADSARMSSIALNIAGNALKYTPKGGRIDFTLKELPARKEGYATFVLTVEDTGIGMSAEYLKVLFEPFTREKSSTVSKIQGTGLGMSIVKNLVDLYGGDIRVQSEPGRGTRFDITIDFVIDTDEHTETEESHHISTSFRGKKILLVEDNELNRNIAVDILTEEGIIVDEAEDGTIAVEILKENGPDYYDYVLMDIQMPLMNGYEATRAIREMYPDSTLPIIALSANAFSEDRETSLKAGMNDHVAKPIVIKELFGVLARL